MPNGRCRSHGGKSTGPTTAAGRERLRAARTVHGCHGAEGREFRAAVADLLAQGRRLRLIRATAAARDRLITPLVAPPLHAIPSPGSAG